MSTLTPADGRNYRFAGGALEDYHNGKDFILHDPTSKWNGMRCSGRDFIDVEVTLRFNKNENLTFN